MANMKEERIQTFLLLAILVVLVVLGFRRTENAAQRFARIGTTIESVGYAFDTQTGQLCTTMQGPPKPAEDLATLEQMFPSLSAENLW
jgi:hypothetical protein